MVDEIRSPGPGGSLDCLIIGGGPAGLTAGIYLARFRRKVLLIDAGASRAARIPESHNHPGFAGISGPALLEALRQQACSYGVAIERGAVESLQKTPEGFAATFGTTRIVAFRVLLATGLTDISPDLPGLGRAIAHAAVRYCPVCDAFEATDANIAVYGVLPDAVTKALFLRTYSRRVTLLPVEDLREQCRELTEAGVVVAPSPAARFSEKSSGISVELTDGNHLTFDVLYPALGCEVHSALATALGARSNAIGCLEVNEKQLTSVDGLYAAGDVVSDLHQICVAEGHAAIAATAIHNSLPRILR